MYISRQLITKTILFIFTLLFCSLSYALDYINTIPNGDFENGQTGWVGSVTNLVIEGRSVYVGQNNVTQSTNMTLRPNTTYNVRCKFMEEGGEEGLVDVLFGIVLYDSQGNEITSSSPENEHPQGINYSDWKSVWFEYLPYFDTVTSWNTKSFTFTTGDSVATGLIKLIKLNDSTTYYYDKIELFERPYIDILDNGNFEGTYSWGDWRFGWNKYLGNMQIETSSDSGFGDKHLKITGDASSDDRGAVSTYDKVLILPNTEYSFSAMLRAETVPVADFVALFGIKFYDKNQNQITTTPIGDLIFSDYVNMHYHYIDKTNFNTQWQPWKLNFITPKNAYSAQIFFYKWCDDQNGNPNYIEIDQFALTNGNDQLAVYNYGFESVSANVINQFSGNYIASTEAFNGRYALEVSDNNWAESAYISVEENAHYLFRTMVMEPVDIAGNNTVYFTIQTFDAGKNSLGQTENVQNMNMHYDGIHWYSYINKTPLDDNFEPNSTWKSYERWFKLPVATKFIKLRLWNNSTGFATRFDNTEIRQLKYKTASQSGTKSMVLWYGNGETWPPSHYISTDDKVKAFYPYIAHATNDSLDDFDEWMVKSVLFMSYPPPAQTPTVSTAWDAYLDNVFLSTGTGRKWLVNLNQAVVDMGVELGDSTHKVDVIISIPLETNDNFSPDNFLPVITAPATDKKVADWYYNNVIVRWNNIKTLVPRINLLGFYLEDEYPLSSTYGFIKELSTNIKTGGYKFYASPYSIKTEATVGGVELYRNVSGATYFMPEYFDTHFLQPNYFYEYTNIAASLVDYSIIWEGLNSSSLNLEWSGNNDRFLHYFEKALEYGLQDQDVSYMIYETAGWLYYCAKDSGDQRSLYDKLNNLLHNRYTSDDLITSDFTADPTTGTVPLTVDFTDISAGNPTTWFWDFNNDGETDSTLQNPSYLYDSIGTYSVKLLASNASQSGEITKQELISVTPITPLDSDNDSIPDEEEIRIGTDPFSADTDSDGYSDSQEINDGSDPLDAGSMKNILNTTICSEWNGFLNMYNFMEHINKSQKNINISTTLYDIRGNAKSTILSLLKPGIQRDISIHDMQGFTKDSYGRVCSTFNGDKGDLDGRMSLYKYNTVKQKYDYNQLSLSFS